MRAIIAAASLLALAGCNSRPSQSSAGNPAPPPQEAAPANSSASPPSPRPTPAPARAARAGQMPANFPDDDPQSNGVACYLYLMIAGDAPDASTGFDAPAMEQAANQWRAQLRQQLNEQEVRQLTASDTNFRLQTAAHERDAAARWCVEHAPEVDPDA